MKPLKAWIKTPLALLFKTFLPISAVQYPYLQKQYCHFSKRGKIS
ncbi:hypothetical protein L932_08055 [Helicobacter pylori PZ5026]|uniref:Uncharacterized protein n=1 Tax=Helicobacter pylori NQ4200 TaxID=992024 RepID=I9Q1D8_HELPX|nr:hypothetical protein HPNQ4200_1320 [Helicobacter pylori NQ4200]EQD91233.1 hypothetical protein L932_08055 [Helicobacter pylori PZ5026]